ncbi:hypothetical protein RKD49_005392 [Streptomyces glaucescens]|jgi:hypothetical protein
MTGRNDVNTDEGKKVVEQIDANIERARSLVEADNAESLEELGKETETLISTLSGKGSIAVKTEKRKQWTEAATGTARSAEVEKRKVTEGTIVSDYTQYEGVVELRDMGAEKVAEGVRLHAKSQDLAQEIARIGLDMVLRIPNKDGNPDIMLTSNDAKEAMRSMYQAAGKSFEHTFETERDLASLQRSVQYYRTDIRAEYLLSLDGDSAEAEEERKRFSKLLAGKPDDVPVSQFLAGAYGTALKGKGAIERENWRKRKAGEVTADQPKALPPVVERVTKAVSTLKSDMKKLPSVEDISSMDDQGKERVRPELEALYEDIKARLKAVL